MVMSKPRLVVFSTLFPHPGQPNAGVFIRERMFRVGQRIPLVVVAPVPWFPLQGLIRKFKPHFRPEAPRKEEQQGFKVYHPRFFSIPGLFKSLDGLFMALGSKSIMRQLKKEFDFNIIDSHFAYPDGKAATLLGQWLNLPVTITMRGTEIPHAKRNSIRPKMISALQNATKIFSVSNSLKQHAVDLGISEEKIQVVGNGVDIGKFFPVDKKKARNLLNIPQKAHVLITVGGLVERKGFHRVIAVMPELIKIFPDLHYLIIGGASAEGDITAQLKNQVKELELENHVHFLGTMKPEELKAPLSAADIFVLSTRNEGWANVLLESLACGTPVVASDVGGNAEVICKPEIGLIVPFDESDELFNALRLSLSESWQRERIIEYAKENSWDTRVVMLEKEFNQLVAS